MVKIFFFNFFTEHSLFFFFLATELRVGFWYSWVFFQLEIAKPKITNARNKNHPERQEQWKGRRKGMQQ